MNVLDTHISKALTAALVEEINLWKSSSFADKLNEETFDPISENSCFFGQTEQQKTGFRESIGRVPSEYGQGRFYNMTPLEIWSAYNWEYKGKKEEVLKVIRYIKGQTDVMPDITYFS